MKLKSIPLIIISFLVLSYFPACKKYHKFAEFNSANYKDSIISVLHDTIIANSSDKIELDSTYILKVVPCETFYGKEQIVKHIPDTSANFASQFSYFVFQKNGRVYYNTKSSDDAYKEIPVNINDTIDVCDESDDFALQGFYRLVEISPDSVAIIKIEFERKKGKPDYKKHYFITAELNKTRTALHILKFDRPRRNTPIRNGLGDARKNYKTYNPDLVFAFPLCFYLYDKEVQLNYLSCPNYGEGLIEGLND